MGDRIDALGRGLGQGFTAGWGDEALAGILSRLDGPKDPEGYDRQYAAGSEYADLLQNERRANAAASEQHRPFYLAGEIAGSAPLAIAGSGAATGAVRAAGLAGRAAAAGGANAAQGFLSGAGHAAEGERLKGGAIDAAVSAPLGAAAEAAPAGIQAAKGLWSRITAPAAEPALATAGGGIMRAQGLPSARPTRVADVPARGSIPPEAMPPIPKAPKPGFRPSQVPIADELAEAADVVHGNKILGRDLGDDNVARMVRARDQLKSRIEPTPEPTTGVRTVRPPRGKRAAPAGPKLPSETGKRVPPDAEQLSFPETPEYQYHATPASNEAAIAQEGLQPSQGGKNFKFAKNRDRVYVSNEEHAPMWAQKLEDVTGEKPLELRTKLPGEPVPGASDAVRIRTKPVPPTALEKKMPDGSWKPFVERLKEEVAPTASHAPEGIQLPLQYGRPRPRAEWHELTQRWRDKPDAPLAIQQEFDVPLDKLRPAPAQPEVDPRTEDAIASWASNGYKGIKQADRGKVASDLDAAHAKLLNKMIDQHAQEIPRAYRGLQMPKAALASGKFADDSLSSWTTNPGVAEDFAGSNTPVVVRTANQRGVPITGMHFESEILTPKREYEIAQLSQRAGDDTIKALVRPAQPPAVPSAPAANPNQLSLEDMLSALRGGK